MPASAPDLLEECDGFAVSRPGCARVTRESLAVGVLGEQVGDALWETANT